MIFKNRLGSGLGKKGAGIIGESNAFEWIKIAEKGGTGETFFFCRNKVYPDRPFHIFRDWLLLCISVALYDGFEAPNL